MMTSPTAPEFIHLHTHSYFSVLGGLMSPKDLVNAAKGQGAHAIGITDTGHGYGLVETYQAAKKTDMKAILGAEVYLSKDAHYEQRAGLDGKEGIVVLIAENDTGWTNLLALLSVASLEGEYRDKQRISLDLLKKHAEGLICLTGGARGAVAQAVLNYGEEAGIALLAELKDIFQTRLYAEFVALTNAKTEAHNRFLMNHAPALGLPAVLTADVRFAAPADEEAADTLWCIGRGEVATTPGRLSPVAGAYMKTWSEIAAVLAYLPADMREAGRANTVAIADSITLELEFDKNLLPDFPVPEGETDASHLRNMCLSAVPKLYPTADDSYKKVIQERLDYELDIITKMGFSAYFLIVEDFIQYAKKKGIFVGPGRGSAAGSLVSYLLDITTIDPLKYELLFERFLNPERVSMPDIDIDFSDERRDEVMQYVFELYGRDRVSKVCTFGTLSAKAALKDVGRALGVPFAEMNQLTKLLPGKPGFMLEDAEEIADFMTLVRSRPHLGKVFEISRKVEGCVRHVSVHACAVIIAKNALVQDCPLQWSPTDDTMMITQFPYQQLESLGLLKMDFLGLKNLSILEKTLDHIKAQEGVTVDLPTIDLEDEKVFEMLSRGETTGVFQFESAGMRRYLRELKPTEFEDLVAMNALYRPGPMEYIPQYIEGKHDPATVKYMHKDLEQLLKKTYGIAVYQEQVLRIAQEFAGFSLGEADILRKAIGKKIMSVLEAQREKFINGAVEKGYDKDLAIKIFDEIIVPFSGYGFNRSHAVCYARIAYETAWCRANYPVEFMAAMMTTDRNRTDRIVLEMHECTQMGIEVLPPSVNHSGSHFTVVRSADGEKQIRFGLTAIKGLGEDTADILIAEREKNGLFKDIGDMARRVPAKLMNKKTLEALAFSGALDDFGGRGSVVASLDALSKYAREHHKSADMGQMGLFGAVAEAAPFRLTEVETLAEDILKWEKESLGLFVSDHPLRPYTEFIEENGTPIGHLTEEQKGDIVTLLGMVSGFRKIVTKTGKPMGILKLEDMTGEIDAPVFPQVYGSIETHRLENDTFVSVTGKFDMRNGEPTLIVNEIGFNPFNAVNQAVAADMKSNKPYIIVIPEMTPKTCITGLKAYLREKRDNLGQEVIVSLSGKEVLIPFRVNTSDPFVKDVSDILR